MSRFFGCVILLSFSLCELGSVVWYTRLEFKIFFFLGEQIYYSLMLFSFILSLFVSWDQLLVYSIRVRDFLFSLMYVCEEAMEEEQRKKMRMWVMNVVLILIAVETNCYETFGLAQFLNNDFTILYR